MGKRGSDIDPLVVGPGGVFTVNTFPAYGHRQPYIRNSHHEADRAVRLLSAACGVPVHVEGLIVTVNAADVTVKGASDGVHVVQRMQLADWLLRHGDVLTSEVVAAVHDVARRSTTWQS